MECRQHWFLLECKLYVDNDMCYPVTIKILNWVKWVAKFLLKRGLLIKLSKCSYSRVNFGPCSYIFYFPPALIWHCPPYSSEFWLLTVWSNHAIALASVSHLLYKMMRSYSTNQGQGIGIGIGLTSQSNQRVKPWLVLV